MRPLGVVGAGVGEHLIDIGLLDPQRPRAARIAGREVLPLGVENDGATIRFIDDGIRLQSKERFVTRADQRAPAPGLEVNGARRKCAFKAPTDERLEKLVHRKQQGKARGPSRRGALPIPREEHPRKPVEVMKCGIGSIEPHDLAKRGDRLANELEARRKLGQPPGIGIHTGEPDEPRHRCLENPVEGRVLGQFVEPAGDTVRAHREMGELALDVDSASQEREVLFVCEVPARHPPTNGGKQAVGEQPDEEFEQIMPLCVQAREFALHHPQIPRDRKHADERRSYIAVLRLDLGEDLDGPSGNGKDADDLSGLESLMGAGQNRGRG